MDFVGLIPAAGLGTRLGKIPCSKELLPVYSNIGQGIGNAPRVIAEYLFNAFKVARITNVHVILRKGKWDIPGYFGSGADMGLDLGYHVMRHPYGIPFSLDAAYPFVKDKYVALGFPDTCFTPENAFSLLMEKIEVTGADLVLGIFPVEKVTKWDMVEFAGNGKIKDIIIKQERFDLKYGWLIAVWNPVFSEYMHSHVKKILAENVNGTLSSSDGLSRELYPGDIIRYGLRDGINIDYVKFEDGSCIDFGTPDEVKNIF